MSSEAREPDGGGENPGSLLRAIVGSGHDLAARMADEVGLGVTDFRALDLLLAGGPLGPNELGRRLGVTPPAATALADRLEAAGHVSRVRDPEDRRRVALVPTEHARAEAWRAVGAFAADTEAVVRSLSDEERAVVSRFLREILDVQRRHAGAR